jgi:phosphohistidine phosphatase SixA
MRPILLALAILVATSAAASPALTAPNAPPSDLTVAVIGGEVHVAWWPGTGSAGQFKLLRRLNTAPGGPDDPAADVLATGVATEYVHPLLDLLPNLSGSPHVYHYAVFACDVSGTNCETTGSHASLAPSLTQCLRGGGYTIFWRHADADVCGDRTDLGTADNTSVPNWWRSCDVNCPTATARQLNSTGVQRATVIGDQIRSLGIPIGRVVSSEFCRCIQTAEWMALGPAIETNSGITYFVYDESNRCTHCYERIGEVPAQGTNSAIIGHAGFSATCSTLSSLAWSECAVFKPDGAGGATLITRLIWSGWGELTTDVTPAMVPGGATSLDTPWEVASGVRIRYRIATDEPVPIRLDVFDLTGRRLWSARPGWQGRGEYESTWGPASHGRSVSRGIYLVRLQAGQTMLSRKVLVLHR